MKRRYRFEENGGMLHMCYTYADVALLKVSKLFTSLQFASYPILVRYIWLTPRET